MKAILIAVFVAVMCLSFTKLSAEEIKLDDAIEEVETTVNDVDANSQLIVESYTKEYKLESDGSKVTVNVPVYKTKTVKKK